MATNGQFKYSCAGTDNDKENLGGVGEFQAGGRMEARRTPTVARGDTRDGRFHLLSGTSPAALQGPTNGPAAAHLDRRPTPSRQQSVQTPEHCW